MGTQKRLATIIIITNQNRLAHIIVFAFELPFALSNKLNPVEGLAPKLLEPPGFVDVLHQADLNPSISFFPQSTSLEPPDPGELGIQTV